MKANKILLAVAFLAVSLNTGSVGLTVTSDPNLRNEMNHMWAGIPFNTAVQNFYQHNALALYRHYYYDSSDGTLAPMTVTRSLISAGALLEPAQAEKASKAITSLSKHELLKMTSRETGGLIEKSTEADKISHAGKNMDELITLLGRYGGDVSYWELRQKALTRTATDLVTSGYLPMGGRKEALLGIYRETEDANKVLAGEVKYQYSLSKLKEFDRKSNFRVFRKHPEDVAKETYSSFISTARQVVPSGDNNTSSSDRRQHGGWDEEE